VTPLQGARTAPPGASPLGAKVHITSPFVLMTTPIVTRRSGFFDLFGGKT
jgi:hypothetical protein